MWILDRNMQLFKQIAISRYKQTRKCLTDDGGEVVMMFEELPEDDGKRERQCLGTRDL
jgi:hypothetical protein